MDIRQLRYFVAVVDAQSITAAAQELHVVQSAISHQMANLEAELGAALLTRSHGGVLATEAGQLLYRHAQAALKNIESARQAVASVGTEVRGGAAIGIPNSTVPLIALPLLQNVRARFPLVEISIFEGLSSMHRDLLANGRLDLAILFESVAPPGMELTPLISERLHFVCADARAREAYAGLDAIRLQEVSKWPLLLPPRPNGIRVILEREFQRAGLELQLSANLSGLQTIWSAVRAGLGGTVMMAANVEPAQVSGVLVLPIHDPEIERPAGIVQLANLPLTQAASELKKLVTQIVRELVAAGDWPGASLIAASDA